jgi:hypothetical protein
VSGTRKIPDQPNSGIRAALATFAAASLAFAAAARSFGVGVTAFPAGVTAFAVVASALGAAPASAAPLHAAAGRARQAAPAAAPPFSNWPTFHGNAHLTGVSQDPAISAANAGNLGVRWMTHTFAPVLSSPVTQYSAALNTTLAYVPNENGDFEAINTATGAIVW